MSFCPRVNSTEICLKTKFLQILKGVTGLGKNAQGEAEWPCFYLISWLDFFMAMNHRLNKPRHWESLHLGVLIPVSPLHTSVNTTETAVISEAVPTIPHNILCAARVNNMTHWHWQGSPSCPSMVAFMLEWRGQRPFWGAAFHGLPGAKSAAVCTGKPQPGQTISADKYLYALTPDELGKRSSKIPKAMYA